MRRCHQRAVRRGAGRARSGRALPNGFVRSRARSSRKSSSGRDSRHESVRRPSASTLPTNPFSFPSDRCGRTSKSILERDPPVSLT